MTALIGDLVGSKRHVDRRRLQDSLVAALAWVNQITDPVQPLELTVGDEFQGGFSTVAAAARASLLMRLTLLVGEAATDSRYGLGQGAITVFDDARSPASQDGPGWWSARAAIEQSKRLAGAARTSFVRTCFSYWSDEVESVNLMAAPVNAFLICRDATVDQMSPRQQRLLLGLLLGWRQVDLAEAEGITQGAVSQNLRSSGAFAIEAAHQRFEEAHA